MKHTPGTWTVHEPTLTDKRLLVLHPDGERVIADLGIGYFSSKGSIPLTERKANARMIADAPKMADYIEYVEAKIDIEEMPFTYEQWKNCRNRNSRRG